MYSGYLMVSIVVSRLRCLGKSADKGHCFVMLSIKTLDLHIGRGGGGMYMGAAATKRDMTCNRTFMYLIQIFMGEAKVSTASCHITQSHA